MLAGKKILLAVCGSIAAYKSAFLVRLLIQESAEVKVIMTESAKAFIGPLTLSTLSKNPVNSSFYETDSGAWTNHVELGLWADLMVIAPASANTLSKMASGACDNLLLACYLSAKCPVMVAPAMDLDMYRHTATINNMNTLTAHGCKILEAASGELASGLSGPGRMAEPEVILDQIKFFFDNSALKGKKVLITSGPTHEAIDSVRFIGNHSTGKMGAALADAFEEKGADVTMISGPATHFPSSRINIYHVTTAHEMYDLAKDHFPECDIALFAAAVSDYRPAEQFKGKRKKNGEELNIHLVENPDIALEMGKIKQKSQLTIGFALESDNEVEYAKTKLSSKNLDVIALNSLRDEGAGFSHETNKVTLFTKDNKIHHIELKSKKAVATEMVDFVIQMIK